MGRFGWPPSTKRRVRDGRAPIKKDTNPKVDQWRSNRPGGEVPRSEDSCSSWAGTTTSARKGNK
eukprot:scaffold287_cov337-Pavlova_lutheri.AAC.201